MKCSDAGNEKGRWAKHFSGKILRLREWVWKTRESEGTGMMLRI